MKKITYLTLAICSSLLTLHSSLSFAAPVSKNVAQTVASNFYGQAFHTNSVNIYLTYQENNQDGQPIYYIFNVNPNKGFVIVAAEDAVHPILGYSNVGHFIMPHDNNNFAWWMNCREQEIGYARAKGIAATSSINDEWAAYVNNTPSKTHQAMNMVNPLVQTTWNQSPYYNATCPGSSVTGCVATCMAQIMKYWNYPPHGHGSSFYWDEQAYGYQENFGYLSADYDTSNYVWASMPLSLSANNSQVDQLMLDCGISVNMDYSPSESGAWVIDGDFPTCAQNSFVKYFGYNPASIKGLYQSAYNITSWDSLIQNELNNNRPLEYVGWDSITNGGHTWVCDGYSSSTQYHMNWGWGGSDNGYFALNALNTGPGNFNWWNEALIGIEPPPVSPYFTASPTMGCSNMNVQFTDGSISDSNNPITAYSWIFPGGNPGTSPNKNPLVQYSTPGTYDVTEIVTNVRGSDTMVRKAYISVASSSSLPLVEGFQSAFPPAGWVINNPNSYMYVWQQNDSVGGYGQSTECMFFNNAQEGNDWLTPPIKAGNDVIGQWQQIYTTEYDFTSITNPKLYFDVAYEPYSSSYSDTLNIYYSTDCGATFHQVYSKGGATLGTTGHSVLNGGDTNKLGIFVPQSSEWRTDTITIAAIAGMSDVMFSFENRSGNGSPVYIDNINIPGVLTSVNKVSHTASVSVYPNPSNGQFTIQSSVVSGQSSVSIYNVLGQQVYYSLLKSNSTMVNLTNQSKGIYIYRVFSENGNPVSTGKLIIE